MELIELKNQADEIHKYFSITKPKNWNVYVEGHGKLIYSPLGTDIWKTYRFSDIKDTVARSKEAKTIVEHNNIN